MSTTVTSKGQVTIPKKIREHLGIRPGTAVDFSLADDGQVMLVRAGEQRPLNRFERLRGTASGVMTTDEIMRLTRGEE